MNRNKTLTPKQCPHCEATAQDLSYHTRYATRDGMHYVFRCQVCKKTFCDRYGTAFYNLKTPEGKVQRAVQQVVEGLKLWLELNKHSQPRLSAGLKEPEAKPKRLIKT